MFTENLLSLFESVTPAIRAVLRRIERWRTPANWSPADWADEEKAVVNLAACEAVIEYRPDDTIPLANLVYFRGMARALTRYRQECAYSQRNLPAGPEDEPEDMLKGPVIAAPRRPTDAVAGDLTAHGWLTEAVESLPQTDGHLIQQLFWQERTQHDVARELQISQRAVSGRRRQALEKLRGVLRQQGYFQNQVPDRNAKNSRGENIFKKMRGAVLKSDSESNIDNREPNIEQAL